MGATPAAIELPGRVSTSTPRSTARHHDRVCQPGGTPAKLLLLSAAVGLLLCWIAAAVVAIRRLGAPKSLDGLRLGALVGLAGGVLQLLVGWLATAWATDSVGGGSQLGFRWGTTGGASFQSLVVLVVLCGLSGLVYASFRSSPRTYEPIGMRVPGWMMPPPESTQTAPPAEPAVVPRAAEASVAADRSSYRASRYPKPSRGGA